MTDRARPGPARTRPLSRYAIDALDSLALVATPSQVFNPDVVDRLLRDGLVSVIQLPSPYASHKGKRISHLVLTEAGEQALAKARGTG